MLDVRTDLFSFGLVIYEMATGHPAFSGSTSAIIFASLLNDTPQRPSDINPEVPTDLEQIISHALEKDRAKRYQGASDIRSDLQRVMRGTQANGFVSLLSEKYKTVWTKEAAPPQQLRPSPAATSSTDADSKPKPRRWKYAAYAAAVVMIFAFAGAALWAYRPRTPAVTAIRQLTHTGRQKFGYVVTDGTRIYFDEIKDGKSQVAEVSTAGGEVSHLDTQLDNPAVQDISPNGSELMVAQAHPVRSGSCHCQPALRDVFPVSLTGSVSYRAARRSFMCNLPTSSTCSPPTLTAATPTLSCNCRVTPQPRTL